MPPEDTDNGPDDWGVNVAGPDHAGDVARVIEGCGIFTDAEAQAFIGGLPDLLADRWAVWRVLVGPDGIAGAAYAAEERLTGGVWNLWFIALLPDARGRGGGTRLLDAVETAARAADARLLLVETGSHQALAGARAFYPARGFEAEARVRDFYAPGVDKIIFRKPLAVARPERRRDAGDAA